MAPNPNLTLFISDIHLSEDNESLTKLFLNFLEHMAPHACALYILGDLFEIWLGDDDKRPLAQLVAGHLRTLSETGVELYLMRGNRDIMMGEDFSKQCNATLLDDPTVIDLYGTPTLLMHGDSLCTLDKKHQEYRRLTLHPLARSIFLHSPLILRRAAGRYLRNKSKTHQSKILSDEQRKILDVNPSEVIKEMNQHRCFQLIHGHTHQAKIHYIKETTPTGTRVVLGDWGDLGNMLVCTPTSLELQSFS